MVLHQILCVHCNALQVIKAGMILNIDMTRLSFPWFDSEGSPLTYTLHTSLGAIQGLN